jgi:hypothetical protein
MTAPVLELRIDPGPAPDGGRPLFAADGEFARAWRCVRAAGVVLPFEVVLHLYAYELLERLREAAGGGAAGGALYAPFWPDALFQAGDVLAHAGGELSALHPPLRVSWRVPAAAEVEASALALFGCLPFDPDAYVRALASGGGDGRRP